MEIAFIVLFLVLNLLLNAVTLWVSARIIKTDLSFQHAVIASTAAILAYAVPVVGWLLSFIVLFLVIKRLSSAAVWPNIIALVLISRLLTMAITYTLFGMPL